LGAFPEWMGAEEQVELLPGDVLVLYSDGVTEAGIESDHEFGEARLVRAMRESQGQPAASLVQAIVDAVAGYSPGARSDDVTVVGIRGI